MTLDRRTFIRATAGAGALLLAGPLASQGPSALAAHPGRHVAARGSRLFPGGGRFVVHTDLHNHTLLSDGRGQAEGAFEMMRQAGLDVAALTDHAVMGKTHGEVTCNKQLDPPDSQAQGTCSQVVGINESSWRELARLADVNDAPGAFVAMRGFEWTTGSLGHVNVWFSEQWIDPLQTGSLTELRDVGMAVDLVGGLVGEGAPLPLDDVADLLPSTASIDGFWEWLASEPGSPVFGGGSDALAGFNHPNSFGNFDDFRYFPEVADRVVTCEAHNGPTTDDSVALDYWFRGVSEGQPWPINACLNAGWRVGLIGVSDNHTDTFGRPDAARGGLWVRELTREGVREALLRRRTFSTTVPGLRLDVSANGVPMGSTLEHDRGPVRFRVDLDRGSDAYGERVVVEVARPGQDEPVLVHAEEVRLRAPGQRVVSFTLDLDRADGDWVLLRICDPAGPLDPAAVEGTWTHHGPAIAYSSPFFLRPPVDPPRWRGLGRR